MGLDTVELVMAVEEEFAIEIPSSEAGKMERVGDMHAFVVRTLRQRDEAAVVDADQIWTRLREVIVEQLGVRPEDVPPTTHFIHDLRAD
jgi:acyl carrier protein